MLILESFQAGLSWECVLNKGKILEKHMTILKLIKYANMMIKNPRINAKRKNNKKQIKNKSQYQ